MIGAQYVLFVHKFLSRFCSRSSTVVLDQGVVPETKTFKGIEWVPVRKQMDRKVVGYLLSCLSLFTLL